jgi:hypothetical protein
VCNNGLHLQTEIFGGMEIHPRNIKLARDWTQRHEIFEGGEHESDLVPGGISDRGCCHHVEHDADALRRLSKGAVVEGSSIA